MNIRSWLLTTLLLMMGFTTGAYASTINLDSPLLSHGQDIWARKNQDNGNHSSNNSGHNSGSSNNQEHDNHASDNSGHHGESDNHQDHDNHASDNSGHNGGSGNNQEHENHISDNSGHHDDDLEDLGAIHGPYDSIPELCSNGGNGHDNHDDDDDHDHDDDLSQVPVPAALWLFGSGLFGLFRVKRKSA